MRKIFIDRFSSLAFKVLRTVMITVFHSIYLLPSVPREESSGIERAREVPVTILEREGRKKV